MRPRGHTAHVRNAVAAGEGSTYYATPRNLSPICEIRSQNLPVSDVVVAEDERFLYGRKGTAEFAEGFRRRDARR